MVTFILFIYRISGFWDIGWCVLFAMRHQRDSHSIPEAGNLHRQEQLDILWIQQKKQKFLHIWLNPHLRSIGRLANISKIWLHFLFWFVLFARLNFIGLVQTILKGVITTNFVTYRDMNSKWLMFSWSKRWKTIASVTITPLQTIFVCCVCNGCWHPSITHYN